MPLHIKANRLRQANVKASLLVNATHLAMDYDASSIKCT